MKELSFGDLVDLVDNTTLRSCVGEGAPHPKSLDPRAKLASLPSAIAQLLSVLWRCRSLETKTM